MDAHDETLVEQCQAGLDESLLFERVANLHARTLARVGVAFAEASRREDAHPADAVAARRRAQQHRQVAHSRRPTEHQPLGRQHSQAQHVDQGIAAVRRVEHNLAADGRYAYRVAVAGDAGHDAFGDPTAAGIVERTEAQRIHQRDRAGAHGEHVAQDATDAGRGALVGLDVGRVVVAPTNTHGASVGSRFRWIRLDLYEQCSDHITAYIASSRSLGARPRMRSISMASSSVKPRARCRTTPAR